MNRKDCQRYDDCNANLCPLDVKVHLRTWFVDEDVCNSYKAARGHDWIKVQRKLAKQGGGWDRGYFFVEMLNRGCMWKKGTTGLDPDSRVPERVQLARWLDDHQPYTVSEEQREAVRRRLNPGVTAPI